MVARYVAMLGLQEQVRNNRSQPSVSRILLKPVVPVLLDREYGQIEGRRHQLHVRNARQGLGDTSGCGDHEVGACNEAADAEIVWQPQCHIAVHP